MNTKSQGAQTLTHSKFGGSPNRYLAAPVEWLRLVRGLRTEEDQKLVDAHRERLQDYLTNTNSNVVVLRHAE